MQRYRKIPKEISVSRITPEGELQEPDFPIPVVITPGDGFYTDGLLGPMPYFTVVWESPDGPESFAIPLCDVLAVGKYDDSEKLRLYVVSDYDLGHNYERVN